MHAFKDTANRTWEITLNVTQIRRVRDALKIDIPNLFEDRGKPLANLFADVCRFVDVLYVLCAQQCKAHGITDEEFGESLGGDSLEAASSAFLEELADFFPPAKRTPLRKMIANGKRLAEVMERRAMEEQAAFDPEDWATTLSESSGAARESSESTPANSPSDNCSR